MIIVKNFKTERRSVTSKPAAHFNVSRTKIKGLAHLETLANPFVMGRDGRRHEVIKKYRHHIWHRLTNGDVALFDDLNKICSAHEEGKVVYLWCWCAPEKCHAEQAKKLALFMLENTKKANG